MTFVNVLLAVMKDLEEKKNHEELATLISGCSGPEISPRSRSIELGLLLYFCFFFLYSGYVSCPLSCFLEVKFA